MMVVRTTMVTPMITMTNASDDDDGDDDYDNGAR